MPFITIGPGHIEYEQIRGGHSRSPPLVMLHEGLGSVSMWKDFPTQLAQVTGSNVTVYSRHGHGRSATLRTPRTVQYMHAEALIVLPQFLDALAIDNPILFGHSDGGSIALIHAGGGGRRVSGVVALAPHVFVEELSVTNISAAKLAYQNTNLRQRLQRYHDDVDGVFWGWNNIWLDPAFRAWNIEEYLPRIACPVLALQGEDDEYGSLEQIQRIARSAPLAESVSLAQCRHSPHRDQPHQVLGAIERWMKHRFDAHHERAPAPFT